MGCFAPCFWRGTQLWRTGFVSFERFVRLTQMPCTLMCCDSFFPSLSQTCLHIQSLYFSKIYSWGQQRGLTQARISSAIKGHLKVISLFSLSSITSHVAAFIRDWMEFRIRVHPHKGWRRLKWNPLNFTIKWLLSFRTRLQLHGKHFHTKQMSGICGFYFTTNSNCGSATIRQVNWPLF